jgi:integrase/recombinase XerD
VTFVCKLCANQMGITVRIVLDNRYKKQSGLYPVKLKVTYNRDRRYYPCEVDLSVEDFANTMSHKPARKHQELNLLLNTQLSKATGVVESLQHFTWVDFERKFVKGRLSTTHVPSYFQNYIAELNEQGRIGTAESYVQSLKSIEEFLKAKQIPLNAFTFPIISATLLREYEQHMLARSRSLTTVGIYLRNLRTIYNLAIEEGNATKDLYPFGKRRYQIPAGKKRKNAVQKTELSQLLNTDTPYSPEQTKAKEFWFLSYCCNGINMKDLAKLRWKQIDDGKLLFVREKTRNTTKGDQKEIVVYRNEYIDYILKKYGTSSNNKNGLVFNIISDDMDLVDQRRYIKNFTRFINQHMKRLGYSCGIKGKLTYNVARHSFTTKLMQDGASLEMLQEMLGHQSKETTMNYWAGFDDEAKKRVATNIMNFDNTNDYGKEITALAS